MTLHTSLIAAKEASVVARVRMTGDTYVARIGKGKDAVTASSTSCAELAACGAAKKHLKWEGFLSQKLVGRQIANQAYIPGLKIKEERGVSYWRVGFPIAEGGVL